MKELIEKLKKLESVVSDVRDSGEADRFDVDTELSDLHRAISELLTKVGRD